MAFHLANRVTVGKNSERGSVTGQRTALHGLSEVEEFAGKGMRAINRQAVSQIRPFVRFLVAQFEREFPPLSRSFRRRPRNTRRHFRRTDSVLRIFLSGYLEKRRQGDEEGMAREGLANEAAELAVPLGIRARLTRSGDGDYRQ